LRIASGERLTPAILSPERRGHAIEARVYAEDPAKKFAPQPGRPARVSWPEAAADLPIETGIAEGLDVPPYYDPLLPKIVAHGETRAAAIARLDQALGGTTIDLVGPAGPASTNLAFLRRVLEAEAFAGGAYDTTFAEALAKEAAKRA